MSEDAGVKSARYIGMVELALAELKLMELPATIREEELKSIIDAAGRYTADARYYLDAGRTASSLASASYAEGLLDAVRMLGLVNFK